MSFGRGKKRRRGWCLVQFTDRDRYEVSGKSIGRSWAAAGGVDQLQEPTYRGECQKFGEQTLS